VTRVQRFLFIAAVFVAAAAGGFHVMARHLRTTLGDRPFVASISEQLRVLVQGRRRITTRIALTQRMSFVSGARPPTPPRGEFASGSLRLTLMALSPRA
jgi:hypothetical protein